MANRIVNDAKTLEKGLVLLPVKFTANGTSAPTGVSTTGVTSVTRTGTGTYLITLQDGYVSLLNGQATVRSTNGTPVVASGMIGAVTMANTAGVTTVVVYGVNSAGTIADFTAANLIEFNVLLTLKNSGV